MSEQPNKSYQPTDHHDASWYRERFLRHTSQIFGLSWPAIMSRMGAMVMATVDTIMVGQYSTTELAYLNLGTGTFVMLALVMAYGMLLGTLVYSADAYGRGDYKSAGAVWRRSLPYAVGLGIICLLICLPSETLFLWMGQTAEMAREGGKVMTIHGIGLFSHLVFFSCIAFLEGIEKPKVAMYAMVLANIVNVVLNYVLVHGWGDIPAMGASGSAIATTILRFLMAASMVLYILKAPSLEKFGVRIPWTGKWSDWAKQRVMGYAAALSLGAEVAAFSLLVVFAGWMGTEPVAAWGVVVNVISLMFMLSAGIGSAASVRVGIANSRHDRADVKMAGWTSLLLNTVGLIIVGAFVWWGAEGITHFYTDDPALINLIMPVMLLVPYVMPFDGGQAVVSNALRGLGETWVPTVIQAISYMLIMTPLSYYLGITLDQGIFGLMVSVWIGGVVSVLLLSWRFHTRSNYVGE